MRALTNNGDYIEIEALPIFCAIRTDIVIKGDSVPVGDSYCYATNIMLHP